MEIIAKTDKGFLINGTESEVKEILRAVQGEVPKEINIGQKIPAIDYSSTITKLKSLPENYGYRQLMDYAEKFNNEVNAMRQAVEKATEI